MQELDLRIFDKYLFASRWGVYDNIFLTATENKFVWNYHFSGLTSIYLFKFVNINCKIKCKICSKLTLEAPDFLLVSLLLTLNIFDTLL